MSWFLQLHFSSGTISILSTQPDLWLQPGVHFLDQLSTTQEAASTATADALDEVPLFPGVRQAG